MEAYGRAGTIAEEVLSAIRIVAAYAGERKEVERYDNLLHHPRIFSVCSYVSHCLVFLKYYYFFSITMHYRNFRYENNLRLTRTIGIQKGLVSGIGQGIVWVFAFGIIALAFWYGGILVNEDGYSPGFVLQVRASFELAFKGVGRHRQGGPWPPWSENSFILSIEATKNRG